MWKLRIIRSGLSERSSRCPYCENSRIHKSRRHGMFEKTIAKFISLNPYRCEGCDARYFIFGRPMTLEHGQASSDSPQELRTELRASKTPHRS